MATERAGFGLIKHASASFTPSLYFSNTNIQFAMLFLTVLLAPFFSFAAAQDNGTGCAAGYQMNCCPSSLKSGLYAPCDDAFPVTSGNWTECNAKAYPGGWVCCIATKVSIKFHEVAFDSWRGLENMFIDPVGCRNMELRAFRLRVKHFKVTRSGLGESVLAKGKRLRYRPIQRSEREA